MRWLFREPARDPALGAALRTLDDQTPPIDPDGLRQRIVTAAAPALRRLRSPAPHWWEWISRWVPIALPVGLAATLAAGLLLPSGADAVSAAASSANAGADSALVIAAFSEADTTGELATRLVTPDSSDWLFEEALSR